ncbi:MAG: 50S ribosomal protein L25 [Deltaproteobacteria bacterium]|nr:50S ribosomal protein L25 [Deltaproteobacteria bacterium]
MDIPKLKVEPRTELGPQSTKQIRRSGRIPAVCYGRGKQTMPLALDPKELSQILGGPRGLNTLIQLDGAEDRTVFIQELQRDPVERTLVHVDFLWVDTDKLVERKVPVQLSGRPVGVKLGGVLQVARRVVTIEALPANLPDKVVVDVSDMEIGDVVHVADIELPAGVRVIYDRNFTICAVLAPTVEEKPEEEAAAEAVEGAEGETATPEDKPAEGDKDKKDK